MTFRHLIIVQFLSISQFVFLILTEFISLFVTLRFAFYSVVRSTDIGFLSTETYGFTRMFRSR